MCRQLFKERVADAGGEASARGTPVAQTSTLGNASGGAT